MSAITISGDLVHYEVLGRGKPVILLHSWLGSWRYWIPTMQQLSMKYRTYAIDLWGFGDSGKNRLFYGIDGQAELLHGFIDRMGIPKAVFVGHGLGAAVMAYYATKPEGRSIVHRMMLIAPPLFGRVPTTARPAAAGQEPAIRSVEADQLTSAAPPTARNGAATLTNISNADRQRLQTPAPGSPSQPTPTAESDTTAAPSPAETVARRPSGLSEATIASRSSLPVTSGAGLPSPPTRPVESPGANPFINAVGKIKPIALLDRHFDTSSSDFEKLKVEVEKADENALLVSTESMSRFNPLYHLMQIQIPTLAVMGDSDTMVSVPDETILSQVAERDTFRLIVLSNARHFPMLEDTTRFTRLMREFFEAPNLDELVMKDEWRRRTR